MRRLNPAATHSEWVSLLDVSGPFLSRKSLERAFPNGLDTCDKEVMQEYRLAYEEWLESRNPRMHDVWIEWVLNRALEYDADTLVGGDHMPEGCVHQEPAHREEVRPTFAVVSPEEPERVLMPILVVPREQRLGTPMPDRRWSASPNQRMQCLLRSAQAPIGLVTNGGEWCLVHVKETETTGFIVFRADLLADEPILLRAFISLLGIRRVIGAADGERLHELLLASREDEEELTTDLGRQVRIAVELLVREIDQLDAGTGRTLLTGIDDRKVYEATLTVMMRLMFLLCAEERKLLPIEESAAYSACYAASTLLSQLEEEASQQGEEILERRYDAWMRLMATSRLVFTGSTIPELQMTTYGGSLFNPEKYLFLERLRINNRVVLHVLESLQYIVTEGPTGKERRRISFEALDVEQIGYVYEGLLDHTIRRAEGIVLGLVGKPSEEPEIPLSVLQAKRNTGEKELLAFLKQETERAEKSLQKLLDAQPDILQSQALEVACGGDSQIKAAILPFLGIIRTDKLGGLQVYLDGSLYVTVSDQRRGQGAHYTPRFLAEEVVQYALEPLVYDGPSEGKPRDEWMLVGARRIVNLHVADIAMGSGAFLVAVCRYLADRLTEAWNAAEEKAGQRLVFTSQGEYGLGYDPKRPQNKPGTPLTTPFGSITVAKPDEELLPLDLEERVGVARRIIADRCLYGVDINPMAVEMAKLSLWLITLRRDRPFTFLDHALKCGDSLVGVSLDELNSFSLKAGGDRGDLLLPWVAIAVNEVTNLRRLIRRTPSNTPLEVMSRAAWHQRAEEVEAALRAAANLLLTGAFADVNSATRQTMFNSLQEKPDPETARELQAQLGRRTFHFSLEFPDVFAEGGFDAIIGNPPFLGGKRITGTMGTPYRDYLVRRLAASKTGCADLSAYFILRAVGLLRSDGYVGYLATNTISEGDTREVGLDQLVTTQRDTTESDAVPYCAIFRAVKSIKWPSKSANLNVAKIWMRRSGWLGACLIGNTRVKLISAFLDDGSASGKPYRLTANACKSFIGSVVNGMGFILEPQHAQALCAADGRNNNVIYQYLNGEDLNSRPDQSPSRWVINFFDWPLGRWGQRLPYSNHTVEESVRSSDPQRYVAIGITATSRWAESDAKERKAWLQAGLVPSDYPDEVAADYPECLRILERLVKPERSALNRDAYRMRWWRFSEPCLNLYRSIANHERVLAVSRVSKYFGLCMVTGRYVFNERLTVFSFGEAASYCYLQSSFHQTWMLMYGSTLETRPLYTPTDCFETYPAPSLPEQDRNALQDIGEAYHGHRAIVALQRDLGLTDTYNLFHNPKCQEADIAELRRLHIEMDNAVRDAYGWSDLELTHDFYGEGKETRFTIAPDARQEVLRRLLKLNHERYAEEVAAGLHGKGIKKVKALRPRTDSEVESLFGDGEIEEAT